MSVLLLVLGSAVVLVAFVWGFWKWLNWLFERPEKPRKPAKATPPERMNNDELRAYSAKLDHQLWPYQPRGYWNHPEGCSQCYPYAPPDADHTYAWKPPSWQR
jgi:hypothetical protein